MSCCKKNEGSVTGSEGESENSQEEESLHEDDSQNDVELGSEIRRDCDRIMDFRASAVPYLWYPSLQNVKQIDYVRRLECDYEALQNAFFSLTTHFARLQFRLRQIMMAPPCERDELFRDLENIAFGSLDDCQVADEMPQMQHDHRAMGDVRRKQALICEHLRSQLAALSEASEIEGMEIIDAGPYVYDEDCNRDEQQDEMIEQDEEDDTSDDSNDNETEMEDTNYGRRPLGIPVSTGKNVRKGGVGKGGVGKSGGGVGGGGGETNSPPPPTDGDDREKKQRIADKPNAKGVKLVENNNIGDTDAEGKKQSKKRK